jgi:hypothetical protein
MRLWKTLFIVAVVGSAFAAGYYLNLNRASGPAPLAAVVEIAAATPAERPVSAPPSPFCAPTDALPPGYDPALVLPPPEAKGHTLEPSMLMIKDHFHEVAGLQPGATAAPPTPQFLEMPLDLTPPVGVEPPLPATYRIPMPDDPPSPSSRVTAVGKLRSAPFCIDREKTYALENSDQVIYYLTATVPLDALIGQQVKVRGNVQSRADVRGAPSMVVTEARRLLLDDLIAEVQATPLRPPCPYVYTNTRRVVLNFEISRRTASANAAVPVWAWFIGPVVEAPPKIASGIKAVELWARRSSGVEYECVDRIESDRPPFVTHLGSEGTYEFRLVCESMTGVKSRTPSRDDPPELTVELDTRKPQIEMLPPALGPAGDTVLHWKATDANLDDAPIRLEFSLDGLNWSSVTGGDGWLPNSGSYRWMVPAELPSHLHLRALARDKAGNVGESSTTNRFAVDLSVPEGRISGIYEALPEPLEFKAVSPPPDVRLPMPRYIEHPADFFPAPLVSSLIYSNGGASAPPWDDVDGKRMVDWFRDLGTRNLLKARTDEIGVDDEAKNIDLFAKMSWFFGFRSPAGKYEPTNNVCYGCWRPHDPQDDKLCKLPEFERPGLKQEFDRLVQLLDMPVERRVTLFNLFFNAPKHATASDAFGLLLIEVDGKFETLPQAMGLVCGAAIGVAPVPTPNHEIKVMAWTEWLDDSCEPLRNALEVIRQFRKSIFSSTHRFERNETGSFMASGGITSDKVLPSDFCDYVIPFPEPIETFVRWIGSRHERASPFPFPAPLSDEPKPDTYFSEATERFLDIVLPPVVRSNGVEVDDRSYLFSFGIGFFN